jgi:hypothetical protein
VPRDRDRFFPLGVVSPLAQFRSSLYFIVHSTPRAEFVAGILRNRLGAEHCGFLL